MNTEKNNSRTGIPAWPAGHLLLAIFCLTVATGAQAQTVITKANTTTMSGAADWGGVAPTNTTIGKFDSTISSGNEAALTVDANTTLEGLLFAGTLNGPVTIGGGSTLTLNSSFFTGTAGIDMSAASQNVTINSALTLKGFQAWKVASGRTLSLGGALTHTGAGVDFSSFAGTAAGTALVNDATGILGPWATTGSGTSLKYAAINGSAVSGYTGGTALPTSGGSATANYTLSAAQTETAAVTGNTLQYTGAAATLTIGAANTLTLNGLINSGTGLLTIGANLQTNIVIGANQELVIAGSTNISIFSAITNNPAGASSVTYDGTGTLILGNDAGNTTTDNSSTFTGDFVINSGIVSLQKAVNLNSSGSGKTLISSPLGNRAVARNVIVNNGAILSFDDAATGNELGDGFSLATPPYPLLTIVVNKGALLRAVSTKNRTIGPLVLNGGTVSAGSIFSTSATAFQSLCFSGDVTVGGFSPSFIVGTNNANLGGGGINLGTAAGQQRTFNVADATGDASVDLTVSAVLGNEVSLANNAVGITKTGAGTMLLATTNFYSGPTIISAGTLVAGINSPVSAVGAFGNASSAIVLGDANTTANNSSPALLTGGSFTVGRAITVAAQPSAGVYTIGGYVDTNSTFSGLITINTNLTVSQVANAGANALTISGGIANAGGVNTLTFAGPGSIKLNTTGITDSGTLVVAVTGGTNTFSVANTYSGGTTVGTGTLNVNNTTGSGTGTGNVTVNNLGYLGGSGTISGNVTVNTGGHTLPGATGLTNTMSGNLTYNTGAEADFDLSSTFNGNNDQVILSGASSVLTCGSVNVGINCGANLDTARDYVLFNLTGGSASISGSFNVTPVWLATTPTGSANYTIVATSSQVLLHYAGLAGPSITASSATPNPALRSQAVVISVSVTPGAGSISSVTVDASPIGGSSAQTLVADGSGNYTNKVVVSGGTAVGSKVLNVTVTDSNSNLATTGIPLTVAASQEVWNGGAGDNNWSSGLNWASGSAPGLAGDNLTFAGTTRLTPLMNNSYSVSSLTFSNNAGSFNIGASAGSSLTLAGGLTNNSASAETLNVPVTLGVTLTVSAAAGSVTLGQNITNGGNLLTVSDGGFNTVINGGIFGSGGLAKNGAGTNTVSGNNNFTGATTVSAGALVLLGTNAPSATAVANLAALQLGSSNSVTGPLALHSGSTLQLRADSSVTFTNGGITLDSASDTNNFDVNSLTGASGNTLTLAGALNFATSANQTINVTGNSTYTLGLGDITTVTTSHPLLAVNINALSGGADVAVNSFTGGNFGSVLNMSGGGNVTVKGKLANTSNGNIVLLVNGGTTATLQGSTTVTNDGLGNAADGFQYYVQNGALVVDNSAALTNNTVSAAKVSWFILGASTNTASGVSSSAVAVTNNNNFNCAVYLGDANFPNGGIAVAATATNIVSDGGVNVGGSAFTNTGVFTIGGQNTSGINTYANPIILGYHAGKSVTVVATAGGEVDFTGGILKNSGDAAGVAALTVGDSAHTGLVKFAGTQDTYPGGTTVAYGQLLVNNTIGTGSSTVTVTNSANLGGNGIILDPVTIQTGATLQPGLGGGDTSALSINNTLNLSGNTLFALNRANATNSSQVTGIITLTMGGTLTVTNAGAPLQLGDTFTLFSATSYTGNFSATNLPALSSGLAWTNNVALNGTIAVVAGSITTPPTIGNAGVSGGNIVFSGTNGTPGQQYRILTSTNVALPVASWTPVATNNFAPNGGYTNSIPINAAQADGFFRLVTP